MCNIPFIYFSISLTRVCPLKKCIYFRVSPFNSVRTIVSHFSNHMDFLGHKSKSKSQIVQFYEGQTVFLTGVTGFLGKIILCQLLDACSTIKKIYLLIRGRQGLSAQARFDRDVLSLEIFQNIFKLKPYLRDILHVSFLILLNNNLFLLQFIYIGC